MSANVEALQSIGGLQTASVETFTLQNATTGNLVIFAQRYTSDRTAIGDPIQITSDQVNATAGIAPLLLSNGSFVVSYNVVDPADTTGPYPLNYFATQEISADNVPLGGLASLNDYNTATRYNNIALSGGAYAYVIETTVDHQGDFVTTQTLGFVDAAGRATTVELDRTDHGDGPFPFLVQTPAVLQHDASGVFTVTWTQSYTPENPDFPSSPPPPTGSQTFRRTYSDGGTLLGTLFIDFDGSKTVSHYAPSGAELSETYTHDGLREERQFGIVGKAYASQDAVYDGSGRLLFLQRSFADGNLCLTQVVTDTGQTVVNYTDAGARQVNLLDKTGRLTLQNNFDPSGALISSDVRSSDGSRSFTTYDPTTGAELTSSIRGADGSRTDTNFAVIGKPYTEQTASYDPTGKLVGMIRLYDTGDTQFTFAVNPDQSQTVQNYDVGGRQTTSIFIAPDGSRDVILRTYSDAGFSPSSIEQDHYGTDNRRAWADITASDGSHRQTAFAAGVTLTSNPDVVDVFQSAKVGGDTFVFQPAFGQDIITSFHAGSGSGHDTAAFEGFDLNLPSPQSQADFLTRHLTQNGNDAVLTLSPSDTLTFRHTLVASLSLDNIRF